MSFFQRWYWAGVAIGMAFRQARIRADYFVLHLRTAWRFLTVDFKQ